MAPSRTPWSLIARQALAAGLAGTTTYDFYLWLTAVRFARAGLPGFWQSAAAALVGRVAFSATDYMWLGLAIHLVIGVAWAGGFAYLANRQRLFVRRWLVAGFIYGIVVYVIMGFILLAGNALTMPPNPTAFVNGVIADTFFFGVPVAFVVASMEAGGKA